MTDNFMDEVSLVARLSVRIPKYALGDLSNHCDGHVYSSNRYLNLFVTASFLSPPSPYHLYPFVSSLPLSRTMASIIGKFIYSLSPHSHVS